ncbi:MAG: hypothetical protein IT437_13355 [Phycisphaerales bacterium]|nr:hypothetical protein [Phycisphaerales bacterium]
MAVALLWLLGRLTTDRTYLTQYVWWVPTLWMVAAAAGLGLLGIIVGLGARGRGGPSRQALAVSCAAAIAVYMMAFEWRLRPATGRTGAVWTVVSWNASEAGEDSIRNQLVESPPDLAAVVNSPWGANFRDLLPEFPVVIHSGAFLLVSRSPVRRWAIMDLFIPAMEHGVPYGGRAMFAEVLVSGVPRTVWVIDLPSDPRLSRKAVTAKAAARLAEWSGPVYVQRDGGWQSETSERPGFPPPDVVMGDFNIPRGSASLATLVPGLVDAFTQGGHGDPASWPRDRPWWALDQVFLRQPLRALHYDVIDPQDGDHRLVAVRIQ